MATNRITKDDISEKDPFGYLRDSAEKSLPILNDIKDEIREIANKLKNELKGIKVKTFQEFQDAQPRIKEANNALNAYEQVQKKIVAAERLRDQALEKNAQSLADVRTQTQILTREQREQSKISSDLTGEYQKQSIQLNRLRRQYKDLAAQKKQNTTEAESLLREINKLDSRLKSIDNSVGQNSRSVGNYTKIWRGLNQVLAAAGITIAIEGLRELGGEILRISQESRGVEFAFQRLGDEGEDAFLRVKKATRGLLSDLDIKKSLVEFDNFNISLEETDTLFEFLSVRAAQTGKSVDSLKDSLVEGLSKESKLRIDNLGISAQELNEELERTPDFVKAVANIAKREVTEAGQILDKAASSQQKWNAFIENTKVALSNRFAPVIENFQKSLLKLFGANEKVNNSLVKQKRELNLLVNTITNTNNKEESRLRLIEQLNQRYPKFLANLNQEKLTNEQLRDRLEDVNNEIERKIALKVNEEKIEKRVREQIELRNAEDEARKGLQSVRQQLILAPDPQSFQALKRQEEVILQSIEINKSRQQVLKKELDELQKDFIDVSNDDFAFTGSRSRSNSIDEEENRRQLTGLIELQREALRKLNEEKERSTNESQITTLTRQIEIAERELKRLEELGKSQEEEIKKQNQQQINLIPADAVTGPSESWEDELNRRIDTYRAYATAIDAITQDIAQNRIDNTNREIENSQQRESSLRALAERGQKDAQQSIAFEQKQQAELEKERRKQEKRKRQAALGTSAVQTYLRKTEQGDKNALTSTIKDITLLTAFVQSLPTFYEGTENIGSSSAMMDLGTSKDPYVVRVHPGERIIDSERNKHINMSNEELTNLAIKYQNGTLLDRFSGIHMSNHLDTSRLENELKDVKRELRDLPKRMPETHFYYDSLKDMYVKAVRKENKITREFSKTGSIWG